MLALRIYLIYLIYLIYHCFSELSKFGVPMGEGGFKLVDVRGSASLLSFHTSDHVMNGTTDAVLIPHRVDMVAAASQLRVVMDW